MYYKANENPFYCNMPRPEAVEITKEEYEKLAKEINDKAKADRLILEESLKPQQEREALIQERMRKLAEDQLIAEGILEKEK